MGVLERLPSTTKTGWPWNEEIDPEKYQTRHWPKISIVTPSFNQGEYLEETIRSILLQNYPNLEYIIIDGGSTDNSKEIIQKYAPWINYWVSEKDTGQANAINKGIRRCTGDIFNWINSDDYLSKGALLKVGSLYENGFSIAGPIITFEGSHQHTVPNTNLGFTDYLSNKDCYNQPGFWFSLKQFKETGFLPERYHYSFDRIFMISYLKNNDQIKYVDFPLAFFRIHTTSKTSLNWSNFEKELLSYYEDIEKEPDFFHYRDVILKTKNKIYLPQAKTREVVDKSDSRSTLLFKLLQLALKYPQVTFNRFYLGALKKALK